MTTTKNNNIKRSVATNWSVLRIATNSCFMTDSLFK